MPIQRMSLPDSFYIALCMTVLLVGAIYWVWTQIQFVQRKVNMLENIVYELKTLCSKPPDVMLGSLMTPAPAPTPTSYPPAPSSVLGEDEDLLHEELQKELPSVEIEEEEIPDFAETFEPKYEDVPDNDLDTSNINNFVKTIELPESSDLQPGGVGSGEVAPSSLENLSLKDLRRLGQQRGLRNANELRKKELIQAIRALPVTAFDA